MFFSVPKEDESEPSSTSPEQEDRESVADIRDPKDYREIFQPKHRIGERMHGSTVIRLSAS